MFLLGGDKEEYSKEYVFNPQKFRYQSKAAPGPEEPISNQPMRHRPDNNYIRAYRSPVYPTNPEQKYLFSEPQTPEYNLPNQYSFHPYSQSNTELTKDRVLEPTEKYPSPHSSYSYPLHPSPISGVTYPSHRSPPIYSPNPSSYLSQPTPHSFYSSNNNLEAHRDTSPEHDYSSAYPEPQREDTKPLRETIRSSRSYSNPEKSFESSQLVVPALYPTPVSFNHLNSEPQYEDRSNSPFQPTPSSISGPTLSPYNQPNQDADINTLNQPAGIYPPPNPSPTYAPYPRSIPESSNPISVHPTSNHNSYPSPNHGPYPRSITELSNPLSIYSTPSPNSYPSPTPTPYTDNTVDTYSSSEKHLLNSKPYSRSYSKLSGYKSFTNPGKSDL